MEPAAKKRCIQKTLHFTPSRKTPPEPNSFTTFVTSIPKAKRARRDHSVTFDQVTVFFFPRCQGFTSVPSRGGCSLGMTQRHSALRSYTLDEFAVEQRQLRREKILTRLREEKLDALKLKLTMNGTQDSEEAERLTLADIPEDAVDLSKVASLDDSSFLHPYSSKQRHALLKAAGVKKIDKEEKRQLHELRLSRENCGCDCQGFCEPETCSCNLAGIKCQMDHSSFPCSCTKDGCCNTKGRIEFNSSRAQTHYIHTIMELELDRRLEEHSSPEEEEEDHVASIPSFPFSTELASAGENSCSSDMTDSSSDSSGQSEDCDAVGCGSADFGEKGLFVSGSVPRTPSPSIDRSESYIMDLSLSSVSDLEFFDGFPCLGPSSLYNSLKEYENVDNFFQFQLPSYFCLPTIPTT